MQLRVVGLKGSDYSLKLPVDRASMFGRVQRDHPRGMIDPKEHAVITDSVFLKPRQIVRHVVQRVGEQLRMGCKPVDLSQDSRATVRSSLFRSRSKVGVASTRYAVSIRRQVGRDRGVQTLFRFTGARSRRGRGVQFAPEIAQGTGLAADVFPARPSQFAQQSRIRGNQIVLESVSCSSFNASPALKNFLKSPAGTCMVSATIHRIVNIRRIGTNRKVD